ncbi:MAG: methyltransferase [Pseudomonadota bacterium]
MKIKYNQTTESLDTIASEEIRIIQSKSGYRFSIDSLLLANFINDNLKRNQTELLELGAGSGVISIILAKKNKKLKISAIEIQKNLSNLLSRNIENNSLNCQIIAIASDISESIKAIKGKQFDIIFSNPPFYKSDSGRINPTDEKSIARHEIKGNLKIFLKHGSKYLKNEGSFYFIHSAPRLFEIIQTLSEFNFCLNKIQFVHGSPEQNSKLLLAEAVRGKKRQLNLLPPVFAK